MDFLLILLLLASGLAMGSFVGALTYRLPKDKSVLKGRSKCPGCGKKIAWYDNIPLLSFILLGGRCRRCDEKIPFRYPAIELASGAGFVASYYAYLGCIGRIKNLIVQSPLCVWQGGQSFWVFPFLLFVFLVSLSVFVIDIEEQFIPDELVFLGFGVSFFLLIIFNTRSWYVNMLTAFGAATFLLVIHLLTKGKGMGLGDVKLALFAGIVLGWPYTPIFLLVAFVLGAFIGAVMILIGAAKFKQHIPFGPFMAASFLLIFIWGDKLLLLIT